jgi:chromate reductase, NAD(P)H dehydrogenase (quinone)
MGSNMSAVNVAVIVGSNRRNSVNRKLARALARLADARLALRIVEIDDLPMYNQDLESSLPASVVRFKAAVETADALLIVTPEHNRSIPAVLKNALDWGTRPYGRNSWAGKLTASIGTSPGAIGTALAQQHLRQLLGNLGALVMGGEAYVTYKQDLVDQTDSVGDEGTRRFLQSFIDQFAGLAARLAAPKLQATAA